MSNKRDKHRGRVHRAAYNEGWRDGFSEGQQSQVRASLKAAPKPERQFVGWDGVALPTPPHPATQTTSIDHVLKTNRDAIRDIEDTTASQQRTGAAALGFVGFGASLLLFGVLLGVDPDPDNPLTGLGVAMVLVLLGVPAAALAFLAGADALTAGWFGVASVAALTVLLYGGIAIGGAVTHRVNSTGSATSPIAGRVHLTEAENGVLWSSPASDRGIVQAAPLGTSPIGNSVGRSPFAEMSRTQSRASSRPVFCTEMTAPVALGAVLPVQPVAFHRVHATAMPSSRSIDSWVRRCARPAARTPKPLSTTPTAVRMIATHAGAHSVCTHGGSSMRARYALAMRGGA